MELGEAHRIDDTVGSPVGGTGLERHPVAAVQGPHHLDVLDAPYRERSVNMRVTIVGGAGPVSTAGLRSPNTAERIDL